VSEPQQRDAVVIGGGVSGLTAAFDLARAGLDVTLLEAREFVGGVLDTRRDGDWLLELGPNTVAEKPALTELVARCGLAHERQPAAIAANRRFVWHRGRLRPLPLSPPQLLASGLLSWRGKRALLREPWAPPRDEAAEETVAQMTRRRLGEEALEVFVGPFVTGIHAGDPERLSARWALPRLVSLEERHGSLLRGARSRRQGPLAFRHPIMSFRGGLATLAEALAARIGDLRRRVRADGVHRDGERLRIETAQGPLVTSRLVLATGAAEAACLLHPASAGRSAPLAELPYAPLAVVCMGLRREQVAHPLDAFGFLTAPSSTLRLLGCVFTSSLFAGRAPQGHVLLTAFVGGRRDADLVQRDDAEVLAVAREGLARTLGMHGEPVLAVVRRWPRAIAQYELGHGRFVALAHELETELPGLRLCGSWLGAGGVADCVALAARAAAELAPPPLAPEV
jgi:oxygen-dependent protoporphyrinogen oxidase